ncbi:hypothetical protein AR687_22285 [Flavobacteriaceae bacterium CRH]|nr:hypothetical protein AR687_22285 [Flavobacteriaceae bacterium CRH]
MKSTLDKIEDIKRNGYSLDFSDVFNNAFENYQKIALYAGLILLIFSILAFFLGGGILVSIYGAEHFNEGFLKSIQNEETTSSVLAIYSLVIAFISALFSPFTAGFLKMAHSADRDEQFNVSTIFSYYNSRYFPQLFIAMLLISLTSGLISVLFNMAGIVIIDTLIALAITVFTTLTIPLIIFGDLKAIDAIKSSITLVSKQPLTIILLLLVAGIASAVGLIGFCIAVAFTIPITYSVKYALYNAILNIDEENSIDSIGSESE